MTFRALQEACETNSRLLNVRPVELKEAGLVEHTTGGYRLTNLGRSLGAALEPLSAWAKRWANHATLSCGELAQTSFDLGRHLGVGWCRRQPAPAAAPIADVHAWTPSAPTPSLPLGRGQQLDR